MGTRKVATHKDIQPGDRYRVNSDDSYGFFVDVIPVDDKLEIHWISDAEPQKVYGKGTRYLPDKTLNGITLLPYLIYEEPDDYDHFMSTLSRSDP